MNRVQIQNFLFNVEMFFLAEVTTYQSVNNNKYQTAENLFITSQRDLNFYSISFFKKKLFIIS